MQHLRGSVANEAEYRLRCKGSSPVNDAISGMVTFQLCMLRLRFITNQQLRYRPQAFSVPLVKTKKVVGPMSSSSEAQTCSIDKNTKTNNS